MSHSHDIFLDHASTTPLHPDAMGVMLPYFGFHYGLPAANSGLGARSLNAFTAARAGVAALIHAQDQQIVFTSGGTEANNLAILGTAAACGRKKGHIITSVIEHASIAGACRHLERQGFRVTALPVGRDATISPLAVEQAACEDTLLISIMHASHVTGTLQPVSEIGAFARSRGIPFHVDASQSAGKTAIDVNALGADLMTISGHKLYGPKGTGALFIRDPSLLEPLFFGTGIQHPFRPGTMNLPGIVALGMACSVALKDLDTAGPAMAHLRDLLEKLVQDLVEGVTVLAGYCPRLPHITTLTFDRVPADSLARFLAGAGLSSLPIGPLDDPEGLGPTLDALTAKHGHPFGALRLSVGWENTENEMNKAAELIRKGVSRIRASLE